MKCRVDIYKVTIAFLLLAVIVLVYFLTSVNCEKNFLSKNIDTRFTHSLSCLYSDIFETDNSNLDDDQIASISGNCQVCRTLLPISSYSGNQEMSCIVHTLLDMAPPNAEHELLTDEQLIKDIGYFLLHTDSKEQQADICKRIQAQIPPSD